MGSGDRIWPTARAMPYGAGWSLSGHITETEEHTVSCTSGMAFATVASVLTGLLFRVLPTWRMSRFVPLLALREGSRGIAGGRRPAQVFIAVRHLLRVATHLLQVTLAGGIHMTIPRWAGIF